MSQFQLQDLQHLSFSKSNVNAKKVNKKKIESHAFMNSFKQKSKIEFYAFIHAFLLKKNQNRISCIHTCILI